jgi:uncharacterized membrane protein (UPF0127 family)
VRRRNLFVTLAQAIAVPTWAIPAGAVDTSRPQPELPKEKLVIVTRDGVQHVLSVEMALTPDQQTVGEMFRPTVPEDGGMLFDWKIPKDMRMWMRNTIAPLDMIFINPDGSIRSIAENAVPESLAVIDSRGPVRATLEVAAGTAKRFNIRVGDQVKQRIFDNAN